MASLPVVIQIISLLGAFGVSAVHLPADCARKITGRILDFMDCLHADSACFLNLASWFRANCVDFGSVLSPVAGIFSGYFCYPYLPGSPIGSRIQIAGADQNADPRDCVSATGDSSTA